MNTNPVFSLSAAPLSVGYAVKVRLSLQLSDDRISLKSRLGSCTVSRLDDLTVDLREASVGVDEVGGDGDVAIMLRNGDASVATLGVLQFDGVEAKQKNLFLKHLSNAVQDAFGAALFEAAEKADVSSGASLAAAVVAGAPSVVSGPKRAGRAQIYVLALVAFAAVCLLAFGVLRTKGLGAVDPIQAATGAPDAALSERVRQQIEQAVRTPTDAPAGFIGSNVTRATMEAMGLKPGKANAGCLVGIPK